MSLFKYTLYATYILHGFLQQRICKLSEGATSAERKLTAALTGNPTTLASVHTSTYKLPGETNSSYPLVSKAQAAQTL